MVVREACLKVDKAPSVGLACNEDVPRVFQAQERATHLPEAIGRGHDLMRPLYSSYLPEGTVVEDAIPGKYWRDVRKHESIPGTPEPLHTRVPEWQFIAYDNVFSSFPGVRGLDQRQKYSKGVRGIQISKKKGIRSKISVILNLLKLLFY